MDENLLSSLEDALRLTPENIALRFTLIEAYYQQQDITQAIRLLEDIDHDDLEDKHQKLCVQVYLENGDYDKVIAFANEDNADIQLCKARAYVEQNEFDLAKKSYEAAVASNAALEDAKLSSLLNSKQVASQGKQPVKLRVISNDDTDDYEVTRIIQPPEKTITFSDVGGLEAVKKQIRKKIITPFQKPSLFAKFRKKTGGGILLYGPPGCGKTLLARATAGECNAKFYNVAISDVLDMYIGESERKLHAIFEQARNNTPAVIFFDEIEALAAKRQHTREATSSKLVSQFLSELDGFAQDNQGVLIIGATNVPWALDPAFRRPGRFDRVVFISPPDKDARTEIITGLLKDRPGGDAINASDIAKQTSGFSGADLMNLVESAVDEAIDESIANDTEVPLQQHHINSALKETKSTTLEWLTMARNYAKYANDSGQYDDVIAFLKKYGK